MQGKCVDRFVDLSADVGAAVSRGGREACVLHIFELPSVSGLETPGTTEAAVAPMVPLDHGANAVEGAGSGPLSSPRRGVACI